MQESSTRNFHSARLSRRQQYPNRSSSRMSLCSETLWPAALASLSYRRPGPPKCDPDHILESGFGAAFRRGGAMQTSRKNRWERVSREWFLLISLAVAAGAVFTI